MNEVRRQGQGWIKGWIVKKEEEGREGGDGGDVVGGAGEKKKMEVTFF